MRFSGRDEGLRQDAARWEIRWTEPPNEVAVLDSDEVRLIVLVVEETRQSRRLGDWRRCRIRVEFVRELLLQSLNIYAVEARNAPEQVQATWRGAQDVARGRKVRPGLHASEDSVTISVGLKEDVADRSHRVTRPGAPARGDSVNAHINVN